MASARMDPAVMAYRLALAMSEGRVVSVTIRDRARSKVQGVVTRKRLDGRSPAKLKPEESNLLVTVAGREVPVDRMFAVAFVRGDGAEGQR